MLRNLDTVVDDIPMPWIEDAPETVAPAMPVATINPEAGKKVEKKKLFDFPSFAPPSLAELRAMHLSPRCLLPKMLFADVRCRIAAGGTGKTTLALFEAATLALGRPLWGRQPDSPVNTFVVTREDGREIMLARLRAIMDDMLLGDTEQIEVLGRLRIMDMTADPFRLSVIVNDVVFPNVAGIDELLSAIEVSDFVPDWVILDPAVSFGVGESRVNDAEQGLIEAARIIRNRLGCCVEYIHHSGKSNAREKNLDQYSGRGGSAFADGSRMVAVLQPLTQEEWHKETGDALEDGYNGLVMALPKMSYAAPPDPVFIKRKGWLFEHHEVVRQNYDSEREAIANQVWHFLSYESQQGRNYSTKDLILARDDMKLSKNQIETAVSKLKVAGRVIQVGKNGQKQTLEAIQMSAQIGSQPSPAGFGEGSDFFQTIDDDE